MRDVFGLVPVTNMLLCRGPATKLTAKRLFHRLPAFAPIPRKADPSMLLREERQRRREEERRYRFQKEAEYNRLTGGDALDDHVQAAHGAARQPSQYAQLQQYAQPQQYAQQQGGVYNGYGMVGLMYPSVVAAAQQQKAPAAAPSYPRAVQQQQHYATPADKAAFESLAGQLAIAHQEITRLRAHNSKLSQALKAVGQWAAQAEL